MEFFKAIRKNIVADTLPVLSTLINEQQTKFDDAKRISDELKQSDETNQMNADANPSPFKKLKSLVANEID